MTQPSPRQLRHIIGQLTRTIPAPGRHRAEPQQSWAGCKLGQRLVNIRPVHSLNFGVVEPGSLWTAVATTSEWVELQPDCNNATILWTEKDWRRTFRPAGRQGRKGTQPSV